MTAAGGMSGEMVLSNDDFLKLKKYIYDNLGINVDQSKREMLSTKIDKILRRKGLTDASAYIMQITTTNDISEIHEFYNVITTNTTDFFRENDHFAYITSNIRKIIGDIPRITQNREIRVWSSASSSGQEPVTLAMVLLECLDPSVKVKILATDISEKVLKIAQRGFYSANEINGIPQGLLQKYFTREEGGYTTLPQIKSVISYRLFNLMEPFSFKKSFDIIFCRNVMIYFDNNIQQQLLDKFYAHLVPGGLLFIGHSESLFNKKHMYKTVIPAIFQK